MKNVVVPFREQPQATNPYRDNFNFIKHISLLHPLILDLVDIEILHVHGLRKQVRNQSAL